MEMRPGNEKRGRPHEGAPVLWHLLSSPPSRPQILRTLDIQVALTGLEVWTEQDQSRVTPDANATLWAFLHWRRGLWARLPHDSAQLLTWVPPPPPRGPCRSPRILAPPGHTAFCLQGPRLPGRHRGPGAHRGHVSCRELGRREHGELHPPTHTLGTGAGGRAGVRGGGVPAACRDRPHSLSGPLRAPHWRSGHHGPRDRS